MSENNSPSALAAAIAAHLMARAAWLQFDREQERPALAAYTAAVAKVPHITTSNSYANVAGERISLSTQSRPSVAAARSALKWATVESGGADYIATINELVEADDSRGRKIARLRTRHRISAIARQNRDLSDRDVETINRVIAAPASSLAELVEKVSYLRDEDAWAMDGVEEAVCEGLRSLTGAA